MYQFDTYLILFKAFSFSVIRRSNASSLASASLSLRSMSPILREYVKHKSKFIQLPKHTKFDRTQWEIDCLEQWREMNF